MKNVREKANCLVILKQEFLQTRIRISSASWVHVVPSDKPVVLLHHIHFYFLRYPH